MPYDSSASLHFFQSSRKLWIQPLFGAGLILRLLLMLFLAPEAQQIWFLPFLRHVFAFPSLDPWTAFLQSGALKSFPYGPAMLAFISPFCLIASAVHAVIPTVMLTAGLKTALLAADIVCLGALARLLPEMETRLLLLYWFSPIILIATYWTGQLDIIPIALLLTAVSSMKERYFFLSGCMLALSISSKLSMALTLPFFLIYFIRNTRLKRFFSPFSQGFFIFALLTILLPVVSPGYRSMALQTPELSRLLDMRIALSCANIFVTPLLFSLVLYAAWRVAHLSFALFIAFLALATLTIVLTTATPPGWYVWALPFLLFHLTQASKSQRFLGILFSLLVMSSQILFWPLPSPLDILLPSLPLPRQAQLYSFWLTSIILTGTILMLGILRTSFYQNVIFRLHSQPISIAIAGDSGTGKDTLAGNLCGLFGKERVVHISGDDYHFWDRQGPLWRVLTHLNPRANDLQRLYKDVNAILDKKTITYRHYQHSNGRFSAPVYCRSKEICLVSGLHVLLQKTLCTRYDLRIYLDMQESLRVLLKCRRDCLERGKSRREVEESVRKRLPDAQKYIYPQKSQADIIIALGLLSSAPSTPPSDPHALPPLCLTLHLRHALYHEELIRRLIAQSTLRVDMEFSQNMDDVILHIEGEINEEDVAAIAVYLLPELEELLAVDPVWQKDMAGVMQLVILCHLLQTLRNRS